MTFFYDNSDSEFVRRATTLMALNMLFVEIERYGGSLDFLFNFHPKKQKKEKHKKGEKNDKFY